jgi:hypothetical protein
VEEGTGADALEHTRQQHDDDAAGFRFFVHLLAAGLLAAIPAALVQATLIR